MEFRLNIYNGKNVEKTYTATEYELTTGVCEDLLKFVDIDKLTNQNTTQEELAIEVIKIVAKSFSKLLPFMQTIFDGLTEEEYRRTRIKEVGKLIVNIVMYTLAELFTIGGNEKN